MCVSLLIDKPCGCALVRRKEQEERGDQEQRNTVDSYREKQRELERRAADAVRQIGIADMLVNQPGSSGNADRHENKPTR
jgi:hypothetical protein